MVLLGIRTIYASEVAYVPGAGGGAIALSTDSMRTFCAPSDADQIFAIARQVVPSATLVGTTSQFTVNWNPNTFILSSGPDEIYAQADTSGGRYMYQTENGYRPIRIQSVPDALDQFVSELVASYTGQTGMKLIKTPQGNKLQWA